MGLGLGVFLVFPWFLHVSSADTHSLQYLKTSVIGINPPEFTAVDQVDGEQIVYYNSDIRKMIPKTEWIKKINADDPDYWARKTQEYMDQQHWFRVTVDDIMKSFHHTKGVHTLQLMYGCELSDDNKTRGCRQFGYDGEDFISLDLKTGSWTGTRHEAEIFKTKWESGEEERPEHWKSYLEKECIVWLKKFVSYGRDALERKDPPETSLFQEEATSPEVVCHATGFFPKAVNISWQKDREDVYEDVELRETLPNQDGSFQKRSILKVPAEELQKHTYTCVIQHSSLEKDVVLSVSERRILRDGGSDGGSDGAPIALIVAVVSALVALVALIVAGIVVWKKKNSGFNLVPSSRSSEGDSSSNNSSSETVCLPAELRERDEEMEMRTGINGDLNGATTQTQLLPSMTQSVELCPDS